MKTNNFRIGNYVEFENQVHEVIGTSETEVKIKIKSNSSYSLLTRWVAISSIKPIPLIEEWLLDFGFNKEYKKGYIGKDFLNQDFVLTEPFVLGEWQKGYVFQFSVGSWSKYKEFKYVHELQNFYSPMTGEELEKKQ